MSIFITGSSGFVGRSFRYNLSNETLTQWKKGSEINIDSATSVIHLAGKAHDFKNTSKSQEYFCT